MIIYIYLAVVVNVTLVSCDCGSWKDCVNAFFSDFGKLAKSNESESYTTHTNGSLVNVVELKNNDDVDDILSDIQSLIKKSANSITKNYNKTNITAIDLSSVTNESESKKQNDLNINQLLYNYSFSFDINNVTFNNNNVKLNNVTENEIKNITDPNILQFVLSDLFKNTSNYTFENVTVDKIIEGSTTYRLLNDTILNNGNIITRNISFTIPTNVTDDVRNNNNIDSMFAEIQLKHTTEKSKETQNFHNLLGDYYDNNEDNSTDYPIIDYEEMYKDTTNEKIEYVPTTARIVETTNVNAVNVKYEIINSSNIFDDIKIVPVDDVKLNLTL